jgi:hypothetical protein
VVKEDGLTNLSQKEGLKLEETPYLTKKELLKPYPRFADSG